MIILPLFLRSPALNIIIGLSGYRPALTTPRNVDRYTVATLNNSHTIIVPYKLTGTSSTRSPITHIDGQIQTGKIRWVAHHRLMESALMRALWSNPQVHAIFYNNESEVCSSLSRKQITKIRVPRIISKMGTRAVESGMTCLRVGLTELPTALGYSAVITLCLHGPSRD